MEYTGAVTSQTTTTNIDFLSLLGSIFIFLFIFAGVALALYFLSPLIIGWIKYKNRERDSLEFVLLQISVPRGNEIKIDAAEQLLATFYSIKTGGGIFGFLKPQPHLSFEIIALNESIKFYIACHKKHQDLVEKQINGAYPDAEVKEVQEYNIFSEEGQVAYAMLKLKNTNYFPIKTYRELPTDPLSAITSALAKMQPGEGAAIQIMISPAEGNWKDSGKSFLKKEKDPGTGDKPKAPPDQKQLEAVENKLSKPGFNVAVRIVVSSSSKDTAKAHLSNIRSAFEQFSGAYNGFSGAKIRSEKGFMVDFIYRYQPMFSKLPVLTSDEIASIFHFPNKSIETPFIYWLPARHAPASEKIPMFGLYLGKSIFRGTQRPVYISDSDRQRHMYIIGRTGVGKSQFLLSLALQDVLANKGLAFIDPHGDAADELLNLIPPNRAKDVVYWDPSDVERPFGMNMLEHISEQQKHFVVESIIGLLYKLYDPNHTGIIGPRLEHAVRNSLLTVMSMPGGTLIEVVRALTDPQFVREILPLVADPIVRRYWTDQIAQTTEFHKSETLDYFVSKFGKFVTNMMIRNIIGQSKPSFDLRKIMDDGKILIVNLSKGKMGEDNSNFLGLVLVPRILATAMSRADTPENKRRDFYLYVDEFQNFATDTFASILSEARKYKLNLIVANQFIGQIDENIKNAIFGNVGTVMAYRVGVTDANFLQHEFAPIFNEQDLVNIAAHTLYVKTQVHGEPIPPFSLNVQKDMKAWYAMMRPEVGRAIKELSRLTYGRDKRAVEAEIASRAKL
ncbi:type IV secretory system conjugative DNA transfer family protein [Candidatus Daviesbacteria bacterium]|nr:type IV secretory system conjugative DNA transfer family protein [Candidatus Daviesbacteria bacterium]